MISQSGDEDASLKASGNISSHRHPTTLVIDYNSPGQKSETSILYTNITFIKISTIFQTSNSFV